MFEYFFHTWNFYNNGSNIIFASQFHIYGWVLVFRDVALAQRFVYFSVVSLISFNMFLVTFHTLKKSFKKLNVLYLASIIASLIYTLNPLVFSEIFHISFLWSYALFPLVFFFAQNAFNALSRRKVLLSSILLSIFFAFMADAWGMLVGLLIVVFVAFSSVIFNGRQNFVHRFIPNFLLTLLIMAVFTVLLASYWLLPYILQRASEPVWDPFSVAVLIRNSQENSFLNIFGLHGWAAQPFFNDTTYGAVFFSVWKGLTLLLPVIAILAVIVRRSKLTLSLSGLLVVGFFLATGVKYTPEAGTFTWFGFGEFYKWLTFYSPRLLPNQAFLLKYPYLFLAVVSLAIALLFAVLVADMFEKTSFTDFSIRRFSKKMHLPIIFLLSLITLVGFIGAPLLTGNLNGALEPVSLPDQYRALNKFFSSQSGSFRVMYVPQETRFNWSTNNWANKIEYWGSGAPPLMYGWGISASPNTGYLGDLIYDYLSTNKTQCLGKLLALANVRYIVFHNDSRVLEISKAFDSYSKQFRDFADTFLKSDEYKYYFLSLTGDGSVKVEGYLNFILKEKYLQQFNESEQYKEFENNSAPILNELAEIYNSNFTAEQKIDLSHDLYLKVDDFRTIAYNEYSATYNESSIYKNLPASSEYLNAFLQSEKYQNYLESLVDQYQDFIRSNNFNNTHNYLNSTEYLVLTSLEYFKNTPYADYINSVEYRGFLYYCLINSGYYDFANSQVYLDYLSYFDYHPMSSKIYDNLCAQKDLTKLPILGNNLFVFENLEMTNYIQAYSKANIVIGGLDTVGSLTSISDFYLNDSVSVFVENQHMSESALASILNSPNIDKTLLFYNNKTFSDLVLDTIDAQVYIAPGDAYTETNPSTWLKDVVTSYSWTPLTLGSYSGQKYDFGLGHNILYTYNIGSVNLPFSINQPEEYSLWLRVLFNPTGGNLTVSIDGTADNRTWDIVTSSKVLNGFKWVNLGDTELSEGSHTLTITSNAGFNAVNLVALPTVDDLKEHTQNLTDIIGKSNATITYVMDRKSLPSGDNVSGSFFAPQQSLYMLSFQANQTLVGSKSVVTIDDQPLIAYKDDSFSNDKKWYTVEPLTLSQKLHNISFSSPYVEKAILYSISAQDNSTQNLESLFGGGSQPYVIAYEKTDPVTFSVKVNASSSFILAFQEPYDELWHSNASYFKIRVNSVNNGFLINSSSISSQNSSITVTYTPEKDFQLGVKITVASFFIAILLIVIISCWPHMSKLVNFQKKVIQSPTRLQFLPQRFLRKNVDKAGNQSGADQD